MPVLDRMKAETRSAYASALRTFFSAAGKKDDAFSADQVKKAVDRLEKDGYSPNYIGYILRVCKSSFGEGWPSKEIDFQRAHKLVMKRSITEDEVGAMIRWAKVWPEKYVGAYVVLSTVFGVRRREMSLSTLGDVDREQWTFYVHTAKKGQERIHLIPECVRERLLYLPNEPLAVSWLSQLFHRACGGAGITLPYGSGWHSIRRSLVSKMLRAGIQEAFVRNYFRWRRGQTTLDEYVVNEGFEIDTDVAKLHPFLKFWEEQA